MRQFIYRNKRYIVSGLLLLAVAAIVSSKRKKVDAASWSGSSDFFVDQHGNNLQALANAAGITLRRNTGSNQRCDKARYAAYKTDPRVYWAVYDVNGGRFLASSPNAATNVYGASVPKVCVAAAALANRNGVLPASEDYQKVIRLLVKSDNTVWSAVGTLAGGDAAVNEWAAKMGYNMRPARLAGNQSNAIDMCRFWADVCQGRFPGADTIFRITNACQTGGGRSLRCMPSDVFIGGKTGTYNQVTHDTAWVQRGNRFFSIVVLTELGGAGSDAIAHMFRGLYDEYCQ